jgi:hypothetical protein
MPSLDFLPTIRPPQRVYQDTVENVRAYIGQGGAVGIPVYDVDFEGHDLVCILALKAQEAVSKETHLSEEIQRLVTSLFQDRARLIVKPGQRRRVYDEDGDIHPNAVPYYSSDDAAEDMMAAIRAESHWRDVLDEIYRVASEALGGRKLFFAFVDILQFDIDGLERQLTKLGHRQVEFAIIVDNNTDGFTLPKAPPLPPPPPKPPEDFFEHLEVDWI